jgi:hypothetical protein
MPSVKLRVILRTPAHHHEESALPSPHEPHIDLSKLGHKPSPNGTGPSPFDVPHVVELVVTSGDTYRLRMTVPRPTGPGGLPDVGALRDFDPRQSVMQSVSNMITGAHVCVDPQGGGVIPQVVPVQGGGVVVLKHVVYAKYLGTGPDVEASENGSLSGTLARLPLPHLDGDGRVA